MAAGLASAQSARITSWQLNTTGHQAQYYNSSGSIVDLNDSSDVLEVCYNSDSIYVRANMLASYVMGDWPMDPFLAEAQNASYVFPLNPTYPSATHQNKAIGMFGLAINGVALYDDGDGKSYNSTTGNNTNNGGGVWNQIAWVAHINEMDAGNAHPDPNNKYHHHHSPIQLCSVTDDSEHSPIVGWAFDGWPIYGPFGYADADDAGSGIVRMTPSWQLRSITSRTTLYDGTPASQTGPSVGAAFPIGTYIEDYEYVANMGDLDYYNGRYCVTPEFPDGIYAYFLNTDAAGEPQYPNMVGPKFYGTAFLVNFGAAGGNAAVLSNETCYEPALGVAETVETTHGAYPNPASDELFISNLHECCEVRFITHTGQLMAVAKPVGGRVDVSQLPAGVYFCQHAQSGAVLATVAIEH